MDKRRVPAFRPVDVGHDHVCAPRNLIYSDKFTNSVAKVATKVETELFNVSMIA